MLDLSSLEKELSSLDRAILRAEAKIVYQLALKFEKAGTLLLSKLKEKHRE